MPAININYIHEGIYIEAMQHQFRAMFPCVSSLLINDHPYDDMEAECEAAVSRDVPRLVNQFLCISARCVRLFLGISSMIVGWLNSVIKIAC